MANPKRKHSKSRRDKRRANQRIQLANLSLCPECGMPKLPHRICPHCGFYKGKKELILQEETEGKSK